MTTGSSSHSHQVVVAGKTYTTNAKAHTHSETADPDAPVITAETNARIAADTTLANAITALTARVAALEVPPVVVPPPVITPVPPTGYDPAPPSATVLAWNGQDQSSAFASLIAAGKQIALEPGKTYTMNNRTQVQQVHGWDLFAQGARVMSQGYYTGITPDSWLRVIACQSWQIRDLELIGPATLTDAANCYSNYGYTRENWRGIIVEGGHAMNLTRVAAHGYWGDPLYIARRDNLNDTYASPDGLTMTDCNFHTAGRNAVSLVAGKNINVVRGSIGNGGLAAWDTEPNSVGDATHNVTFTGTNFYGGNIGKAGMASHDSHGNSYTVYVSAGQGPAYDYVLDGCTFDVGAIYCRAKGGTNTNITIKNCSATTLGDATFQYSTGIVFTNNTNINRVDM